MKKLPPKEELKRAIARGATQADLARAYGASRQAVHIALTREPSVLGRRIRQRRDTVARLRAQGMTWAAIAAKVGASYETVMRDARKLREEKGNAWY